MAKGYIIEGRISAKDNEALNRSAVCSADVDGGKLVSLGALTNGLFTATVTTSGNGLWMAYNPSEHLIQVGTKLVAGETITSDPRDYTNIATRPLGVFKPQVGDIVKFTDGNIKTGETVTVGSFLEQEAGGLVVKVSATASTSSFKVLAIDTLQFPQAGIGMENAKIYVCECVAN